jgi:hypothetical protein
MKPRPITYAQILAGRTEPAGRKRKSGFSRECLAAWGVPFPPPPFWMVKLVASGIPYVEPTEEEIRASPELRAVIWTPPL